METHHDWVGQHRERSTLKSSHQDHPAMYALVLLMPATVRNRVAGSNFARCLQISKISFTIWRLGSDQPISSNQMEHR